MEILGKRYQQMENLYMCYTLYNSRSTVLIIFDEILMISRIGCSYGLEDCWNNMGGGAKIYRVCCLIYLYKR